MAEGEASKEGVAAQEEEGEVAKEGEAAEEEGKYGKPRSTLPNSNCCQKVRLENGMGYKFFYLTPFRHLSLKVLNARIASHFDELFIESLKLCVYLVSLNFRNWRMAKFPGSSKGIKNGVVKLNGTNSSRYITGDNRNSKLQIVKTRNKILWL